MRLFYSLAGVAGHANAANGPTSSQESLESLPEVPVPNYENMTIGEDCLPGWFVKVIKFKGLVGCSFFSDELRHLPTHPQTSVGVVNLSPHTIL